jgi:PIN domain nuclease of toxin-antitoxin system
VANPGHVTPGDLDELVAVLSDETRGFEVVPVSFDVTVRMRSVPREWTTDTWDRAIIATSVVLDSTLVTADGPHRKNPKIDTLW